MRGSKIGRRPRWWLLALLAGTSFMPLEAQTPATGLLLVPVDCVLYDASAADRRLAAEAQAVGSAAEETATADRCAADWGTARAALIRVEVEEATAWGGLKLWAGSAEAEPAGHVLATSPTQGTQSLVLLDLCGGSETKEPCSGEIWARMEEGDAVVRLRLVGLFEAPSARIAAAPADLEAEPSALEAPFWLENANGIHFSDGAVGIKAALPERYFQVGSWDTTSSRYLMGSDNFSMQGIAGKDNLPYIEIRNELQQRAFYLGWGSKTNKYVTWKFENGYDLAIEGGNIGYGVVSPERNIHLRGTFKLQDPISGKAIFDTWPRTPTGYGGGAAHNRSVPVLQTFFQRAGVTSEEYWIWASPEVWGGESAYSYAFDNKNLRFGVANDSWRRAEIEIYNDNTSTGKILFRTGAWQDPDNQPATASGLRMVIDGAGNVGVGTPNPAGKLVVTHDVAQGGKVGSTVTFDAATDTGLSSALTLRAPGVGGTPRELLTVKGDGQTTIAGALEVGSDLRLAGRLVPVGDLCIGVCP